MKKCHKCNTLLEEDELFCHECGAKQADKEEIGDDSSILLMKKCMHCGETIDDDSVYCPYCGKRQEEQPDRPDEVIVNSEPSLELKYDESTNEERLTSEDDSNIDEWSSNFNRWMLGGVAAMICVVVLLAVYSTNKRKEANNSKPASEMVVSQPASSYQTSPPATTSNESNDTPSPEKENQFVSTSGVKMGLWGSIGENQIESFCMEGTTGWYNFQSETDTLKRVLKFVSYNPADSHLVLDAYFKDEYIGRFEGEYYDAEYLHESGDTAFYQGYRGNFVSVKGVSIDFHAFCD